jgi:hypothetical protein
MAWRARTRAWSNSAPRRQGKEKRSFNYLIPLENLGVEEDQVIGYFVWADDHGPDGKPRRTFSDIFFAEVGPLRKFSAPNNPAERE